MTFLIHQLSFYCNSDTYLYFIIAQIKNIMTFLVSKISDLSFLWKLFAKNFKRIFFLLDLNKKIKLIPAFICFRKFCGAREKQEWETRVLDKDSKKKHWTLILTRLFR